MLIEVHSYTGYGPKVKEAWAMEHLRLPEGWVGIHGRSSWQKPYGRCSRGEKLISVHPPKWIPPWCGLRGFFSEIIWSHEVLHAWGSPGCRHPFCLGYEGPKWTEYLAMPLQLLAGLYFCNDCMRWYERGR